MEEVYVEPEEDTSQLQVIGEEFYDIVVLTSGRGKRRGCHERGIAPGAADCSVMVAAAAARSGVMLAYICDNTAQ